MALIPQATATTAAIAPKQISVTLQTSPANSYTVPAGKIWTGTAIMPSNNQFAVTSNATTATIFAGGNPVQMPIVLLAGSVISNPSGISGAGFIGVETSA